MVIWARPYKATTRSPALVVRCNSSASPRERHLGFRLPLGICTGENQAGLKPVDKSEESQADQDEVTSDPNQATFETEASGPGSDRRRRFRTVGHRIGRNRRVVGHVSTFRPSTRPADAFFEEPRNRRIDPPSTDVEKIIVPGIADQEQRDGPRGGRGEFFAHGHRDHRVAPSVPDQDRAMNLGDLTQALEAMSQ